MTISLAVADFWVLRALRLGPFRVAPYGLCAAAGLLLAMGLVRRTARRSGLDPERVWDAGLFAILSCFLASRLLLVLSDPKAFVKYPLLVLALPSLTIGGMAAAAVAMGFYLRRKHIAPLPSLDAYAAPAAVLAALLELGHALDGSEVGVPSTLPWSVADPWSAAPSRVHPVAWYGLLLSLALAVVLWRLLPGSAHTGRLASPGGVAALGLGAGGALAFGLDMLTQPVPALVELFLEPGEWLAVGAMLAGALLWTFAPAGTRDRPDMEPRFARKDAIALPDAMQTEAR